MERQSLLAQPFSSAEVLHFFLVITILVVAAKVGALLFKKLHLPEMMGEILAGVLFGSAVLGALAPSFYAFLFVNSDRAVSALLPLQDLGLMLLMFCSTVDLQVAVPCKKEYKLALLLTFTGLLFPLLFTLVCFDFLPFPFLHSLLLGSRQDVFALKLIFAMAIAIPSLPMILRILSDLHLLKSSFARIVLNSAIFQDLLIYGALSVLLASVASKTVNHLLLIKHTVMTALFLGVAIYLSSFAPEALKRLIRKIFSKMGPLAVMMLTFSSFIVAAILCDVAPFLGALVAGMAILSIASEKNLPRFQEEFSKLKSIAYLIFIPLYFMGIGMRLDLLHKFHLRLILLFFLLSSVVRVASLYLGTLKSTLPVRERLNIAVALNTRGVPGIILATLAFSAGIISEEFCLALIMASLFTATLTGMWLAKKGAEN
ncbi:MAG: cation:proton antiporter [Oligoflexia bacterium]|nr:cation:proton antiporter [Oligoflexia bacterium]